MLKKWLYCIGVVSFLAVLSVPSSGVVYAQSDEQQDETTQAVKFMVVDSAFCEEFPAGEKWCAQSVTQFNSNTYRVYCATKIFSTGDGQIAHVWYYNGERTDTVPLRIKRSSGYRTRSYKTIGGRTGDWKVEVIAGDQVLETLTFTVVR